MTQTGGVNPFDIPAGTSTEDPRIQTLTKNLFCVGVKIKMGIPSGVLPADLPPVVTLGNSANNVTFNMFCSELEVIQNMPGAWGTAGSWNVWSQPSGSPWYIETTVDLTNSDLDNELNTAYFNQHPKQQKAILAQLENMSSTAFSLQQLLFDLDNAVLQTVPTFEGIPPSSNAQYVLETSFVNCYSTAAKNYGEPLVAVTAVVQGTVNPSQIQMTSFEREVSQYMDSTGNVVQNPTPEQAAVTTLDNLCMINNDPFPGVAGFTWNWVQPGDVDNQSGVIAVNRQVFSQYLLDSILPSVEKSCISSNVHFHAINGLGAWSSSFTLLPGQSPQTAAVTAPSTGAEVINIAYSSSGNTSTCDHASCLAFHVQLNVQPSYTCQVSITGSTITIVQRLWVFLSVRWDSTTEAINAYDTTITDLYDVSVDDLGALQIICDPTKQTTVNNAQSPHKSNFAYLILGINDSIASLQSQITQIAALELNAITFTAPQNFVFPGAKVFTYATATFSDSQDLICDITYADPSQPITPPSIEHVKVPPVINGGRGPQPLDLPDSSSSSSRSQRPAPLDKTKLLGNQKESSKMRPLKATYSTLPNRPKLAATAVPVTMSHTSDLIQNYVQGEIVAPTGKFEALQTDDGHSMLFGMNTANALYVIIEQSGESMTGWQPADLSSALVSAKFPGSTSAVVRTFDVGQSALDGTIGMAMAVSSGASDNLFLSLYNSSTNTSWAANPSWTPVPFDAPNTSGTRPVVSIVGILFAETLNGKQYIIVDIDSSTTSAVKDISRYYIDPLKASGTYWTQHKVPVDIEEGNYQSCVGRIMNGYVDGVYTSGTAGTSAQLVYVPVINVFGGGPPLPCRLSLPGGVQASVIATARNVDTTSSLYGTTDLYAVSGSVLYRFPSNAQTDGSVGNALIKNHFFSGTSKLSAMTNDGVTTIWGHNANDQVYYISCPTSQLSVPGAWSAPVPILAGVELMSLYINRSGGGNTIFASGGGKLQRLLQATDTDAKIWRANEIKLQSVTTEQPLSFNSYTTTIQVLNSQNLLAGGVNVSITASSRTPVYMEGLYYVLSPTPVTVVTDPTGSLTIVEPVEDSISGTLLTVTCDGGATYTTINPMDESFQTMASLNTERSLRAASFPTNTVAGGTQGTPTSALLVATSTSSNDVNAVADSMSKLNTVYGAVKPATTPTPAASTSTSLAVRSMEMGQLGANSEATTTASPCMRVVPNTLFLASPSVGSLGDDIAIAAGDLFRWLKSGVPSVIQIIKDAVSDAWHFLATIEGNVYRAALDSVDAVIGAVEWVFNAIETGIEELIQYLEFLFDWDDIKRTKDVLCNITEQWLNSQVESIPTAKAAFDGQIANMEKSINQLAGITDWSTSIGQVASQPTSASASNPAAGQTSGSHMLSNHYKNHGGDLTIVGTPPSVNVVQQVIDDLLNALEQEGQVLSAVYTQLQDIASNISSMNVGQVLTKLAAVFADGVLSSVQVVMDALFDVLTDLASAAVGLLETKIHIPIISDILNAIGIPDLSFLDLLCWIPALSYTVVYKIANNKAPFPDNADVQSIISANSWETLQALLTQPSPPASPALALFRQERPQNLMPESSHMFMVRRPQANSLKNRASMNSLSSYVSVGAPSTAPTSPGAIPPVSAEIAKSIYIAGHIFASFCSLTAVYINYEEERWTDEDDESDDGDSWFPKNPWTVPSAVLSVIYSASSYVADTALPKDPIQDADWKTVSRLVTGTAATAKLAFTGPAQGFFATTYGLNFLAVNDPQATGAAVDFVCVVLLSLVTVEHFSELGNDDANADRSAAIVGEVANIMNYAARLSRCAAINDQEPESKLIFTAAMDASLVVTGGLQFALALIH